MSPKILIIPGSDRVGSHTVNLAGAIAKAISEKGGDPLVADLTDYDLPLFSQNIEADKGVPEGAKRLGALIAEHQAIILVTPEYNSSIPPLLKNAMDWLSRDLGGVKPYQNRTYAICACSPGALGGIRVLSHMRDVLVSIGADTITPQLAVGNVGSAIDENQELTAERPRALLQKMIDTLIERAHPNM